MVRSETRNPRSKIRNVESLVTSAPTEKTGGSREDVERSQLAILHAGKNDEEGRFYYVMELADASEEKRENGEREPLRSAPFPLFSPANYTPRTLRHDLDIHSRLPFSDCLQIGLSLTTALAHLHKHGLVHRDIKPSNIIFVNGTPKLADIGLITDACDSCSIVGTEGYLAPEGPGTPQADIYSLGKVLYEISMGSDRRDFPDLPLDWKEIPERDQLLEFNEILLKACAAEVLQRYKSAAEMQVDLELLQRGKSVKQRRTAQRRLHVVKIICAAAALLALSAAALLGLLRGVSFDSSNPAYRLSKNEMALKEYIQGIHCSLRNNPEGVAQAIDHFNLALKNDPKFIMAYNGLFEMYIGGRTGGQLLGLSPAEAEVKLRAYAAKLMELDPKLAEAQAAKA